MIEKGGMRNQGSRREDPRWGFLRPAAPRRSRTLLRLFVAVMAVLVPALAPATALAQARVLVVIGEAQGVDADVGRAFVGHLAAELRRRSPDEDAEVEVDASRTAGRSLASCETRACRSAWLLARHRDAALLVELRDPTGRSELTVALTFIGPNGAIREQRRGETLRASQGGSWRRAAQELLAGLTLPPPSAVAWEILCDTLGARVWVDDQPVGVVPLAALRVSPGRHVLRVSAPGIEPVTRIVEVGRRGARTEIRLR